MSFIPLIKRPLTQSSNYHFNYKSHKYFIIHPIIRETHHLNSVIAIMSTEAAKEEAPAGEAPAEGATTEGAEETPAEEGDKSEEPAAGGEETQAPPAEGEAGGDAGGETEGAGEAEGGGEATEEQAPAAEETPAEQAAAEWCPFEEIILSGKKLCFVSCCCHTNGWVITIMRVAWVWNNLPHKKQLQQTNKNPNK